MMFGVAEDHASNPLKTNLGNLKKRGVKFVSVNPIKTGYSAIADEWIGLRPGTDGLFVASLIHELFKADKIDLDYLIRYTNAPWLVIQDEGAADDGLIARDENDAPLCFDQTTKSLQAATGADVSPAVVGEYKLSDGRTAVPSFQLMAARFLDDEYAPENVAASCGIKADTIKRIAAELAHYAFEEEITLDIPWTDWAGRKHEKMIGRPISMHAMRGISAHSNGFHTCRMLHVLQIILGSIDCPGGFRYKAPFPKSIPPHLKPAGKMGDVKPNTPLPGAPLGFVKSPDDLLVDGDGKPLRIDKAYSWDAPIAAHGLMHMVITNAANKDPYGVDLLFMYMANMSWNSSMNVGGIIEALTRKEPDSDDYVIPKIIYSDAYYSEMVPYADLILPDTTYLERWDCISLLDRPISDPDTISDSIRQPVLPLDRDVKPFQDVMLELGHRIGLPGMTNEDGSAKYPGGYSDYIVNHQRKPGIGPLGGWRGEDGKQVLKGSPNEDQLKKYIENGCFWSHELDDTQKYFKHANKSYIDWAHEKGITDASGQIIFELYSETLQRFRLAARGHGDVTPPAEHRERIETYFDPLPFWHKPFEEDMVDTEEFPIHALSQRPMAMYHSWGSQNAWLRQIHTANYLYMNAERGAELVLKDEDWVWVKSHHGKLKAPIKLMDNVNRDTAWTWNAIGKRSGTWGLDEKAPESQKGFLLNHIISELLPEKSGGYRFSNSDPITGQAAWYDLRVSITKAEPTADERSLPEFDVLQPTSTVACLEKMKAEETS